MLGAIAGDIIGSIYEFNPIKRKEFPLFAKNCTFTDDTVLTVAVAEAILTGKDYKQSLWKMGRKYPNAGYGGSFYKWLISDNPQPYNSWGNGSTMRVSPVGFAFKSEEKVLQEAKKTAEVSHNHSEGIKGAQATALAIFLAIKGNKKEDIKRGIEESFDYDLNRTVDEIRPNYSFDVSCQGTVPEVIISFLDSETYEDAIRNAISLGGDSDTLACITGRVAEAFYGEVKKNIMEEVKKRLTPDLLETVMKFKKNTSIHRISRKKLLNKKLFLQKRKLNWYFIAFYLVCSPLTLI